MLKDVDIYGLVELLGQASGLDSPLFEKKRFLLAGLCTLIGAQAWAWSWKTRSADRRGQIESANGGDLTLLTRVPRSRTGKWALNFSELSDGAASSIVFLRHSSSAPFTGREKLLAQIACEEIPWLHEPPRQLPAVPAEQLSPRQRETLDHLMAGLSYQEVSERMGISRNTVHGYVKDLYRFYGQHSRAGLITSLTDTRRTV